MYKHLLIILGLCMAAPPAFAAENSPITEPFLTGGDISMLPKFEELGAQYRDNQKPQDAIRIMMDRGCNCFRLRLFVRPTMKNAVIQDLPYTVKFARRLKKAGARFLLDIHYSDTWADPGKQYKPAAWKDLDFPALEKQVETYTANVLKVLKEENCLPDIVQVGNEITPGFLWPEGKINAEEGGWDRFAILLKAGIRGVKQPLDPGDKVRIMIHSAPGGSAETTAWFFQNIEKQNIEFDTIGLSYYPWWHGSIKDLQNNLKKTAETFGKDIIVVETAYPWRPDGEEKNMVWPQTPQGQKQFLKDVIQSVRSIPNDRGKGVIWWYPESIPVKGLRVWKGGNVALFDVEGNALPALDAFQSERDAQ